MNNDLWTEISSNGLWMRFDAISTIFAIGAKMVNEAARLHFTLFAPCRFAAIAKALHSKAGGFSSHLHRSPGEVLLVRSLPSVVCSSRHSAAGATADEVANSAHLLVRRSLRRRRMKFSAPRIPRGASRTPRRMGARIVRHLRKLPYFSVAFSCFGLYIIPGSCVFFPSGEYARTGKIWCRQ